MRNSNWVQRVSTWCGKYRWWIAVVYLGVFIVPSLWLAHSSVRLSDGSMHHYASVVAFNGGNPYNIQELNEAAELEPNGEDQIVPYLYPPTSLLVIGVTKHLDHDRVRLWWAVLGNLALLASFLMLHRRGERWELLMLLLICWRPAWLCVIKGQVSLIMLCCVLWATYARSGVAVALGGLLKITPAGLLIWLLRCRSWSGAFVGAGLGLAGVGLSLHVFGADLWVHYVTEVLPIMAADQLNELGFWTRQRRPTRPNLNALLYQLPEAWGWLDKVGNGIRLGIFGFWFLRPFRRPDASAGALVAMILYFGPTTWAAHLSMLLLPVYVLAKAWLGGELTRAWKWIVAFGVVASSINRDWFEWVIWYLPELTIPYEMLSSLGVLSIIIACLYLAGVPKKRENALTKRV